MNREALFRGRDRTLWNFWKHGVTSSFLDSFLSCREQTRLSFVEGWTSRMVPISLEFGSCMHWCLEQVYATRPKKPEQLVGQYEKEWLSEVPDPTTKQLQQQEVVYGLAEAVLPSYLYRWSGDFNGGKYEFENCTTAPREWVRLERVFAVPYIFADGRRTWIRGRQDGVFKDRRGKLWVFDTKCRSVIDHDIALETLPFDLQQMLYLWAARLDLKVWPVGTIMNIVRRPGQRQLKDETLPVFLKRVAKEVSTPKNFDHYFVRYEMAIMPSEVLEWKAKNLDPLMKDVRNWYEGLAPHYLNPQALVNKYGKCRLYLPIVKNDYVQCYRRPTAFNELKEVDPCRSGNGSP